MSHGPSQAQGLIGRETPDSLVQPAYLRAYAANPNQVFSGKRLVSYVAGLPRKPGWVYSSTNYVLAQMIIERVTHDSYADQLRRRIITPRPAQHVPRRTSLPARGDLPAPGRLLLHISPGVAGTVLAVCHRPEPLHGVGAGLGRIVSSPPDVTKWARALFTGRELPRKQQRELESLISTKTGEPIKNTTLADPGGFGLGVEQTTDPTLGTVWAYEGATLGFRFLLIYFPRSGSTIAVGVNSLPEHDNLGLLAKSVYETLHKAGVS